MGAALSISDRAIERSSDRAIDVEFLVSAEGRVLIVQARPYTMVWSGDRRWKPAFD